MADDEVIDGADEDDGGELERLRVDMPFDQTNYDLLEVSIPLLRVLEQDRLAQDRLAQDRLEQDEQDQPEQDQPEQDQPEQPHPEQDQPSPTP